MTSGREWRDATPGGFTEAAFANDLQDALMRLLIRLHAETSCGTDAHWPECQTAVAALGFASFEVMNYYLLRGDL